MRRHSDGMVATRLASCAVCNRCHIYIRHYDPRLIGTCIYGGPFDGYLDLRNEKQETANDARIGDNPPVEAGAD